MTTRNVQRNRSGATADSSTVGRLTHGLGWFSIGLGLAEIVAPGAVSALIGVRDRTKTRTVLRLYGLRELAAGVGIFSQPRPAAWLWARVAGDALDLTSLLNALGGRGNDKARVALGIASVAGVTVADVYCARTVDEQRRQSGESREDTRVARSIIVDKPIEDAYNYWRDFENLPRFMDYLQSVRYTGDRRTHWIARGPAGARIEWDAEIIADEPNRRIAWRSVPGSSFQNSGSVRFERAPGGRGTMVRVEVDFSGNRGAAALGTILHMDLGRRIMHDLRNFKRMLEVGEIIQSEASIHPGMHPAQPEPVYQH
jgi:uncharacterized membrane protein